ncbi:MAG TPA: hypothetical protein VHB48_00580, partial [Chitinophagaceae bacterium]|nr:hypothetical protein [Chitinophagaceae bacterium]
MLFSFIRYTQPGWQFNIIPRTNKEFASCYINEKENIAELLDKGFETYSAQLADAGYNLCIRGKLLQSSVADI